jgi:hypothetical protein
LRQFWLGVLVGAAVAALSVWFYLFHLLKDR